MGTNQRQQRFGTPNQYRDGNYRKTKSPRTVYAPSSTIAITLRHPIVTDNEIKVIEKMIAIAYPENGIGINQATITTSLQNLITGNSVDSTTGRILGAKNQ